MAILLQNVDPTLFNFVSGVVSVVTQALLLWTLRKLYGVFCDWHVANGKQLPVRLLGNIPPNFVSAVSQFLQNFTISVPIVILLLLFACADFSDSLARLGIEFVATSVQGVDDTVMVLDYEVSMK